MSASSPLRSSASIEVDLSVTPFRRWKKSHFSMQSSKVNRRYSSGPIPTFSNKSLGDFVRPRKLDMVLKVYPADMPLLTFCHIDPNTITIEDEALREKVIVALHAARACCVMNFEVSFIKKPLEVACLTVNFYRVLSKRPLYRYNYYFRGIKNGLPFIENRVMVSF